MIRIRRGAVSTPRALIRGAGTPASQELNNVRLFLDDRSVSTRQSRFKFSAYRRTDVLEALLKLFSRKCAFCESPIGHTGQVNAMQFRPPDGVAEAPDHRGYWWLAMSWANIYSACSACMRASGGGLRMGRRFPLEDESKRARQPGEEKHERPLLLDPCKDEPAKHLYFAADGSVVGLTERGHRTILEFDLNREGLVQQRSLVAMLAESSYIQIERLMELPNTKKTEGALQMLRRRVSEMTSDDSPYAAVARRMASDRQVKYAEHNPSKSLVEGWYRAIPSTTTEEISRGRKVDELLAREGSKYTLRSVKGREQFKTQRRLLMSIEIKNLRGIRDLSLKITEMSDSVTPWLTLLGENGVGKSTVLQAVSIALGGPSFFKNLLEQQSFDMHGFVRARCKSGEIAVQLSSFKSAHRVRFTAQGAEFVGPNGDEAFVYRRARITKVEGKPYPAPTVLVGYGATRLIPDRRAKRVYGAAYSRADNLFDPLIPLANPHKTLMELSLEQFDHAAEVIKELLDLPQHAALKRNSKRGVLVHLFGDDIPLERLSDGYQGVIGLVVDMLGPLYKTWNPVSSAQGVVIVDEIGTHLHPSWRMRIVRGLKNALPGIQFITSTHDPLCLRGLEKGEVVVLQRDSSGVIAALTDLPSPAEFRVEQLLTSEFFGLNSTVDPEVEAMFRRYFELLSLTKRTASDKSELAKLKQELERGRHLGETPRDRVMYRVIDKLIAKKAATTSATREDVAEQAALEISEIWKRA